MPQASRFGLTDASPEDYDHNGQDANRPEIEQAATGKGWKTEFECPCCQHGVLITHLEAERADAAYHVVGWAKKHIADYQTETREASSTEGDR